MVLEIIMIALGIALVVAGYVIPARKDEEETAEAFSRDQVQEMVSEEVESVKGRIDDIVDETVQYSIEKAERSMDRLSNEKMMAVSEYSDTVLEQINKSHEEVVFLYDMLNDKHENLKETVAEATRTASEVNEKVREAEENLAPIVASAAEVSRNYEAIVERKQAAEQSALIRPVSEEIVPEPADDDKKEKKKDSKKEAKNESKTRNKPVPVVKNDKTAVSAVLPRLTDDTEDMNSDYVDDDWEAEYIEDDEDDDVYEAEGPEITFNPRSPGSRNSNERILELHKAGKSNMAIAKELGLGIGEVKLVIDLFKGL